MSSKVFYSFLFGLLFSLSANATTCSKSYTLGFFNGVWNTEYESFDGTQALRNLIGDTYNNEPIHYESFYNHTGSSVGATALQDIAETFIQRSAEIDASGELGRRFEYFWEFIGSSEPTFIDKIKGIFSNAISLFESLYTAVNTKLVAIISYFTSNPPTESDYATHNAQLDALAANGQKLMLVGHSQGNLFMNHAYDHILPIVTKTRVSAAHIAPASPTVRGDYVLANIDLVINLLRVQGLTSVQANNLDINTSRGDVSGHTLIGTYLDPTRDGRAKVKTMIDTAMGESYKILPVISFRFHSYISIGTFIEWYFYRIEPNYGITYNARRLTYIVDGVSYNSSSSHDIDHFFDFLFTKTYFNLLPHYNRSTGQIEGSDFYDSLGFRTIPDSTSKGVIDFATKQNKFLKSFLKPSVFDSARFKIIDSDGSSYPNYFSISTDNTNYSLTLFIIAPYGSFAYNNFDSFGGRGGMPQAPYIGDDGGFKYLQEEGYPYSCPLDLSSYRTNHYYKVYQHGDI